MDQIYKKITNLETEKRLLSTELKNLTEIIINIESYIENKKVHGKSVNFSERDIIINEIIEELEEIIYQEEE